MRKLLVICQVFLKKNNNMIKEFTLFSVFLTFYEKKEDLSMEGIYDIVNLLSNGREAEALEKYQEIEAVMSQCFGEQNPDLLAIRKKIAALG